MKPYQEEYLENCRRSFSMTVQWNASESFEAWYAKMLSDRAERRKLKLRSTELLEANLFAEIDAIFDASEEDIGCLEEFAQALVSGRRSADPGLSVFIRDAVVIASRRKNDRDALIRRLYNLGMACYGMMASVLIQTPDFDFAYTVKMRMSFTEAASYLKYYDTFERDETKGYIVRSLCNISLGSEITPKKKLEYTRRAFLVISDKDYREKAPSLPWDRFLKGCRQQMASSVPSPGSSKMTPDEIETVMDAAWHTVEDSVRTAEESGKKPPARWEHTCSRVFCSCGLITIEELLSRQERLMDSAVPGDYSDDGLYRSLSIPAHYMETLSLRPELLQSRISYIGALTRRLVDFVKGMPDRSNAEKLFGYLGQVTVGYIEVPGGVSYRDFITFAMKRMLPEEWILSALTAKGCEVLSGFLVREQPDFFDDIPEIGGIEPAQKEKTVCAMARRAAELHDVGKIGLIPFYEGPPRSLMGVEDDITKLHTSFGEQRLSKYPSTRLYADTALGHHSRYDEADSGSSGYIRRNSPVRALTDVVSIVDFICLRMRSGLYGDTPEQSFGAAVEEAVREGGKRFSPIITPLLRDSEVLGALQAALTDERTEWEGLYREIFPCNQ